MYTIHSAEWEDVKDLWEQWRTYDLVNPIPTEKLQNKIRKVWVDPEDIFAPRLEKTLVMREEGQTEEIIGVLQIQDFSTLRPPLRVAGIKNVAVPHELRNNGIGRKLMEIADLYLKFLRYDMAILYSSLYASQYRFYEKFGYERYEKEFRLVGDTANRPRKAHLKFYAPIGLPTEELDQMIRDIGKF